MNPTERIAELRKQIEAEEAKIRVCQHCWGRPFSNPETVREGYGHRVVPGFTSWWESEGYHDVQKPRWTRTCVNCGLEQHTKEVKTTATEPVFR